MSFRVICINVTDRSDEEAAVFNGVYSFEGEARSAYIEAITTLGHDPRYKISLQTEGAVKIQRVERRRVARAT